MAEPQNPPKTVNELRKEAARLEAEVKEAHRKSNEEQRQRAVDEKAARNAPKAPVAEAAQTTQTTPAPTPRPAPAGGSTIDVIKARKKALDDAANE